MEEDDGGVDDVGEGFDDDQEEDIYGDLESDIFVVPPKKRRLDEILQLEDYENLKKENRSLKCRIKKLERENNAYHHNISSLFVTARNEMDKKNFIIKNLQEKLKEVTKFKSKIPSEEAEEILVKCQEALQESQAQVTLNEIRQTLNNLQPACPGLKKRIQFGNMSIYFYHEQGTFQRKEMVIFPKPAKNDVPNCKDVEDQASSRTSYSQSSEQSQRVTGSYQHCKDMSNLTPDNPNGRPPPSSVDMNKGHHNDNADNSSSAIDAKRLSPLLQETYEPESDMRRRNSDKDSNRTESERGREVKQRTSSGERHYNYHKHARSRDYSPPSNDRHLNRRPDKERYNAHDRKSEGYRKHGPWRNQDNRPNLNRRYIDTKHPYSAYGKSTRSRSRSK